MVLAGLAPAEATRLLGEAPGWLGDLGPAVEAVCLQLALHRPPATPIVLGVDQPLYLSPHAPLARLAPPGGAMVEVDAVPGAGPTPMPSPIGPSSTACGAWRG